MDSGIVIADKYGENDYDGIKQLHDAGIVYYPESPYLLCIMTKGKKWGVVRETIVDISKTVLIHTKIKKRAIKILFNILSDF